MKSIPRRINITELFPLSFLSFSPPFFLTGKKKNLISCSVCLQLQWRSERRHVRVLGGQEVDALIHSSFSSLLSNQCVRSPGIICPNDSRSQNTMFHPAERLQGSNLYILLFFLCFYPSIINIILCIILKLKERKEVTTHVSVPSVQLSARLHPGKQE